MENETIFSPLVLTFVALICGAIVTLIAIRRAPDGFEDNTGCHLEKLPRPESDCPKDPTDGRRAKNV